MNPNSITRQPVSVALFAGFLLAAPAASAHWAVDGLLLSHAAPVRQDRALKDLQGKRKTRPVVPAVSIPLPEVVVRLRPGVSPSLFADSYGLRLRRVSPRGAEAVLGFSTIESAKRFAALVRGDAAVLSAYQNRKSISKRRQYVPNDPYFVSTGPLPQQWNVNGNANGYVGADFNLAWRRDTIGTGVTIGIVDDGLERTHEDIAPAYSAADSFDFGQNDADPSPVFNDDDHGTAVAGVAGARGNNGLGIAGAAPGAALAGLRVDFVALTVQQLADATLYRSSGATTTIGVKNHSYGPASPYEPTPEESTALDTSAASGTIHVFAAGNDRGTENGDANKTQNQANPNSVTIASSGPTGTFSDYSSFGANVAAVAPSDTNSGPAIFSTDRIGEDFGYNGAGDPLPNPDYTSIFGGSSASAPLGAGAAAIVKGIRPTADVRYFKHLLAITSIQIDPTDSTVSSDGGWKTNAAGRKFNQNYGFGLISPDALSWNARVFSGVTALQTENVATVAVNAAIPDATSPTAPGSISRTFTLSSTTPLEDVLVRMNIVHGYRGDLSATLTSPSGTSTRLFINSGSDAGTAIDWTFDALAFWGENPAGTWTITVRDNDPLDIGTWNSFSVSTRNGTLVSAPAVDGARFASQNVPATVTTESVTNIPVTFQNTGTTSWTSATNYRLSSENPSDNTTWGGPRVNIPAGVTVRPGGYHTFVVPARAPAVPGTYNFRWRLVRDGVARFGDLSANATINVVGGALAATFVSSTMPATIGSSQTISVTIQMKNEGTETWVAGTHRLSSASPDDTNLWRRTRIDLTTGTTVVPGGTGVFTGTVTAPAANGTYAFQYRMIKEGVARFGQPTPLLNVTVSGVPLAATFVSQQVPSSGIIARGSRFPVSITMRNTGTETWNGDFRLASEALEDNSTWGRSRIFLPAGVTSVAPGAEVTFTASLLAPNSAGPFDFQWRMVKEGVAKFGDRTTLVSISPVVRPLDASFDSQTVGLTMTRSTTQTVTVRMTNTGTETWTAGSTYRLASENPEDNSRWGRNRVNLTTNVATGQTAVFTFTITAPATAGTYPFQWRMVKEGVAKFGAVSTVQNIVVN